MSTFLSRRSLILSTAGLRIRWQEEHVKHVLLIPMLIVVPARAASAQEAYVTVSVGQFRQRVGSVVGECRLGLLVALRQGHPSLHAVHQPAT